MREQQTIDFKAFVCWHCGRRIASFMDGCPCLQRLAAELTKDYEAVIMAFIDDKLAEKNETKNTNWQAEGF